VFDTQFEASPPASWSGATDVKADGERSETLGQLNKAEAEVRRLSSFLENMRHAHERQLIAVRAECSTQTQRHVVECERLRNEAAAAIAEVSRLQRALAEERQRSGELLERAVLEVPRGFLSSLTSPQAIAPIIASLEVEAFRQEDSETRSRLKKKLQLKWHPDKCINAALAKCVLQELQQQPEWMK
jgi:hypothetical protein